MPNYPYTFQLPPLNVQDIPNDGAPGEFLGISAGGVLDWLPVATGGGDMLKADNLSGLTNYATARTNIGLGTASTPTFANLTLTSPSLSSSAPVTISQTWNGTGSTVFKALVVNATTPGTTSSSSSLLLDLQLGGASKAYVDKNGAIYGTGVASGLAFKTWVNASQVYNVDLVGVGLIFAGYPGQFFLPASSFMGWNSNDVGSGSVDTKLFRDSASGNTLALRNGALAQTFNVYGTSSSGNSVYSRLAIACDTSGNATLTTQSTGVAGTVSINGVPVGLGKGNVSSNVAVGTGALSTNTTGTDNVAVGFETLGLGTTGSESVAVGWRAAKGSSVRHVSIGYGANQLGANDSVSVGWASMFSVSGGSLNVAVGRSAGYFITGGSTQLTSCTKSLFLGCDTKALGQSQENQIVIGYDATGIGSNSVVLGNDSITKTALKGNVGIGTTAPGSTLTVAGTLHFGSNNGALPGGTSYGGHIGSSQDFALRGTSTVSTNYYLQNGSSGNKNAAIRLLGSGSADHGGLDISAFESSPIIFSTNLTEKARFSATGNLGIGTTSPSSKLQVSAGDVEVDTIAKGVILKSPDGTRYRVTVANGGTLSVAAV